ncbi:hypothetical protein [Nocardioides daeguensis]|uniref:Glycosyltransferase RgtA/B/C/D-like domain-containing protein n=1 Tax=Nocardioides daeguensis TaxID=908359 RepID=A0ABP6USI7_9ACTN|nr:hypothetical protein [Nocardioides daeguensis]MBV6725629.1 hypothetical protein [Nocardioides daeguensis]MCR1772856.1 hypothetical protein [Nocardioides daeguensis]
MSAWRGRQAAAAIAVMVTMVVGRAVLLAGSWFNQDDFYLSGRAASSDLTAEFLVRDTAGHVNPLQQLAYWLLAHGAPYSWGAVASFVLLLQSVATIVMWLLLTRLLGERWSRVVLLAVFAWAPLTLATTLWWSAAMGLWPHVLCSVVAVWLLVRWRQGDARAPVALLAIVATTAVGLAWHERAVLIPPVLYGVAVALADEAVGWRRLWAALTRFRWLWFAQTLLLGAFLVGHALLTDVVGGESTWRQRVEVSWSFLGRNVVPGLFGGPWTGELDGGAVRPDVWVVVLSSVLALAGAVLLLRRGGPARRWGLAFVLGYVAADLALLLSGRAGFGSVIGLDPRYSSDTVHAAVLGVALCLRGSRPWLGLLESASARVRGVVVAGTVLLYGAASAAGTALLVPHFQNTEDKAFVTTLRAQFAANPTVVLFDRLAPRDVVLPLVGADSQLSRILAPLPEDLRFDEASARLRMVADDGSLRPVELAGVVPAEEGPDGECGYEVDRSSRRAQFVVPVDGRLLVRVSYFTAEETTLTAATGDWSADFLASRGPNQMWLVLPDRPGDVDGLTFRGDGRSTVCITGVEAGLPEQP